MNQYQLSFEITDEYRRINQKLREQFAPERTCWINPEDDRVITLTFSDQEVQIQDEQKGCKYKNVINVKETGAGLFLLLPKNRFLFIPVTENKEFNVALMHLARCLGKLGCPYLRVKNLCLNNIGLYQKLSFLFRKERGIYIGPSYIPGLLLMLLSMIFGLLFLNELFLNPVIDRQQAICTSGIYLKHEVVAPPRLRDVNLYFQDLPKQKVDGCCTSELTSILPSVSRGTQMELLIHPKSKLVLEIKTTQQTLLNFDDAIIRIRTEAVLFAALGGLLILVSLSALLYLIHQNTRGRFYCV